MISLRTKITELIQKIAKLPAFLTEKILLEYEFRLEVTNLYMYLLYVEIISYAEKKNKANFYSHLLDYMSLRTEGFMQFMHPAEIFDFLHLLLVKASFSLLSLRLKTFRTDNSLFAIRDFFPYWTKLITYIIVSFVGTVEYVTITIAYYNSSNYLFYKPNFTSYRVDVFFFYKNIWTYNAVLVFYKSIRALILPLFSSAFISLLLLDFFSVNFLRQISIWFVVGSLFFWLISGFNFFLKRYRFGKFTSALQRFWKRANSYFWLIEGFLFLLFFYYYLNSSQEPIYFYDESSLNQTYLFSLVVSYQSYLLLVFLIFYCFYFVLSLTTFNSKQQTLHILLITLGLIYIYLIENYQVYYILTSFFENFWAFDAELNVWKLESESPKLRLKHQYLLLALIAKYWHFLFIFLSWLFMFVKTFEQKKISYVFFGVNIQNLVILFGLNFLFNVQWLKWLGRRYLDQSYFWFFTDVNQWSLNWLVSEITNFFVAVLGVICVCKLFRGFLSSRIFWVMLFFYYVNLLNVIYIQ